jgi:hypothetical protein
MHTRKPEILGMCNANQPDPKKRIIIYAITGSLQIADTLFYFNRKKSSTLYLITNEPRHFFKED